MYVCMSMFYIVTVDLVQTIYACISVKQYLELLHSLLVHFGSPFPFSTSVLRHS